MLDTSLPEHLKGSKQIFKGSRIDLYLVNQITRNGERHQREVVMHPGAVVILPLLNENEILFIRNYRIATGEILLELPAGTLEKGEQPVETAKRELLEETGYACSYIESLNCFYTTPGFCNERMYAFWAKNLHFLGQKLDPSEEIKTESLTLEKASDYIREGVIKDGKTIATFLYFYNFVLNKKP
ncbi:ADP-ribose pyrophosphatase [Chlamydiales bacterium STE3]|nr:ADP-ribose pyrophosphatase [Chlamydiales bacterium STE3]